MPRWQASRPRDLRKWFITREESFFASRKRHPFLIHYTTGATKEGRILAVKVEIIADTGAYAASGPTVLLKSLIHAAGPYEIPNVFVRGKFVYTNNPVGGAMRGLGVPQVAVAHESQMDILAETLHLDPFEIRLKNGLKPGSITATGQRLGESVGLAETIEKVRDEISRRGTPRSSGSKRYGWGIGAMFYGIGMAGRSNPGITRIEADETGEFTLYTGIGDGGQGSSTVLSQIAAEVLRMPGGGDPVGRGGYRLLPGLWRNGGEPRDLHRRPVRSNRSREAEGLLQGTAASIIEIDPEDLRLENGFFLLAGSPPSGRIGCPRVRQIEGRRDLPFGEGVFDPEIMALDPRRPGHPDGHLRLCHARRAGFAGYGFGRGGGVVRCGLP